MTITAISTPRTANRISDGHPPWCTSADRNHPSHVCSPDAVAVPATAGRFVMADDGVAFSRVDIAAAISPVTRGVRVAVYDPADGKRMRWAAGTLSPAEARRLMAAIAAELARVEGEAAA